MLLAILRLLAFLALVVILYRLLTGLLGGGSRFSLPRLGRGGGSGFKCRDCRHCGKLFVDGVLCRYGDRETFKNPTHISNCMDYERK